MSQKSIWITSIHRRQRLIYDKDGNQIADVGAQLRENITYDEVPEA
jgi:membrane carboxypeptidase/penicillin-binding protein